MRKIMKLLSLTILAIVTVCVTSYLTDKTSYSNWQIIDSSADKSAISWTKFEWTSDTLNGRYFEKLSMNIPCKVEWISNTCTFQFDLGSDLTGVYENTFSSFYNLKPELKNKIKRLKSNLQFWNGKMYFDNFKIHFGNYIATNKIGYVFKKQGEELKTINLKDTIHLGTIGADLFQNKILIIDYPNQKFAICENIPDSYKENLIDIELDKVGRIILPMKIHNKSYRIMFDNGSSIFPIITQAKNIDNYSTLPDIDTIRISSWGQIHGVTGKIINDTFELAGQKFSNIKVYANHSGLGIDKNTDGTTGNALFWDRTIIIDFKTKKFGVK